MKNSSFIGETQVPITAQDEPEPNTCSLSFCPSAVLGNNDFCPATGSQGLESRSSAPNVLEELRLLVKLTENTILSVCLFLIPSSLHPFTPQRMTSKDQVKQTCQEIAKWSKCQDILGVDVGQPGR